MQWRWPASPNVMPARDVALRSQPPPLNRSRVRPSNSSKMMEVPVTFQATPYQTSSVPDQRRMTMSYVAPALAAELSDLVAVVPRRGWATSSPPLSKTSRSRSTVSCELSGNSPMNRQGKRCHLAVPGQRDLDVGLKSRTRNSHVVAEGARAVAPTSADLKVPTSQPRRVAGASRQRRCWAIRTLSSALTAPAPSRASTPAGHIVPPGVVRTLRSAPASRIARQPSGHDSSVADHVLHKRRDPGRRGSGEAGARVGRARGGDALSRWRPARAARDRRALMSGCRNVDPPAIDPAVSSWLARFSELKPLWLTNSSSGGVNFGVARTRSCQPPGGSWDRASAAPASPSARRRPGACRSGLRRAGGSSG